MNRIVKAVLLLCLSCLAALCAGAQTAPRGETVAPVAIVSNEYLPSAVAVDEKSVYWVTDAGSKIKRVNKAGGDPTIVVTGQRAIREIFVDENYIFFVVLGEIKRASKDGGPATTLVSSTLIGYAKILFDMDQTSIYFLADLNEKYKLLKVRKDGGAAVTLASKIYLPAGLATDGTNVYWTDLADDRIRRVSVNGGPIKILGRCSSTLAVALDGEELYCLRSGIARFSKTDSKSFPMLTIKTDNDDHRLVFDEANFYTRGSVKGAFGLYKISRNGGRHELMAPLDLFTTSDFVIDSSSIYWTDSRRGTVMRLSK